MDSTDSKLADIHAKDKLGRTRSLKPFAQTIPLLVGGVDHPLLRVEVENLRPDAIEPRVSQTRFAHAPPQFADQIGDDDAFLARGRGYPSRN